MTMRTSARIVAVTPDACDVREKIRASRAQMKKPAERALSSDRSRLCFLEQLVEMIEGLLHGQSVHFAAAIFAGFNGPLQIVSRDLHGHRICDYFARLAVVFHPRGMRES